MSTKFIHLRVHTDYSLGYGAIKVQDLVDFCAKEKIPAIAVSDRYNLFSSMEFSQAAIKSGIQPIMGCVINVVYEESDFEKPSLGELLILAKNRKGYSNLLKIVSDSFMKSPDKSCPQISYNHLKSYADGLIVLCGTEKSPVGLMLSEKKQDKAAAFLEDLNAVFKNNLYIEILRRKSRSNMLEDFLLESAQKLNIPIVATNEVCFLMPEMTEAHDALICISAGESIYSEARNKSDPDNYLKSEEEMMELFSDLPEAIDNTVKIAKRISVFAESRAPMLPRCHDENVDEDEEIENQAIEGLNARLKNYKTDVSHYFERLKTELRIIKEMKFSGYFLIVSDFIKWSKRNGIPVGPGRGSGVGSMVAWSLEITDVDPIRFGLLFERFLNPDRVSMPDFDVDFCQERRDEVIQYVRNKYGHEKVGSIITFGKLQAKAVLRDVGRVLGMGFNETDKICKMVPNNPANPVTLQQAIDLDKELQYSRDTDPRIKKLLEISLQLEGMNRHASTHAAGIVIADRPIEELVPLYKDDSSDMPIIQYPFKYAEIAGLVKFDFLGLKTLTIISEAVKLIKRRVEGFELDTFNFDDKKTYELLSAGQTIGVFQFESAGMREAIKKLKPDAIEDLIALGSLYRPGPMDNIPSYINRKHGLEKADYIHPMLESILKETYGIIVYQEQVMQIAQVMAGYTLGGADLLRRAMGKKNKAEMEAQRDTFIKGSVANGVDKSQASEIFNFVDKFASYGFNKSHAAAYAIISYHTAYLKANYPVEFLVASMNLELNDTDKIHLFCEEARSLGIKVLPPHINESDAECITEGAIIRYGLGAIKNVGIKAIKDIVSERNSKGLFLDITNFISRCGAFLNKRMLEKIIQSGALNSIHDNQAQLYENSDLLLRHAIAIHRSKSNAQKSLFGESSVSQELNMTDPEPWSDSQKLEGELESLGFYLSTHPLAIYQKKLEKRTVPSSKMHDYATKRGAKIQMAGVITSRKIRSSARGKYAFIQMSDLHGLFEVSVFNEALLTDHNDDLQVGQTLYITVDARKDDNGSRFVIDSIQQLSSFAETIKVGYSIYSYDPSNIRKISFTDSGIPVRIIAIIDDHHVSFKSSKPLYISHETLSILQSMENIKMVEEELM